MTVYTIFGAGPGGLYTAWRLLTSGKIKPGDSLQLIEWGNYAFPGSEGAQRSPSGRICTQFYQGKDGNSYIEIGGMRYIEWDDSTQSGHQLVTKTIEKLNLNSKVVEFNTTTNPLYYMRGEHFYNQELLDGTKVAPYKTPGNNQKPPAALITHISDLILGEEQPQTRSEQCKFYANGTLPSTFNSFVYNPGDIAGNIGYWNVFYDQASNEGFRYAADGNGYSSNVINWNAANAAVYNGEFAPGGDSPIKTLSDGYSELFTELFTACQTAASAGDLTFTYTPNTRLHSIWRVNGTVQYQVASASNPDKATGGVKSTDYAFMAMPPNAISAVADATRYLDMTGKEDFLNAETVRNYVEAVIEQPSYKVAMFFDKPWWDTATYPPKLVNGDKKNVFGPTITDLPLRQIYYFGNNATNGSTDVYGLLASYDDMRFTKFWQELEVPVTERRTVPISQDLQPLVAAGKAPATMERMLLLELAKVHYGTADGTSNIPYPLETYFMNWGLNPFGAGYHAWAAHYDLVDVMQKIRTPTTLAGYSGENNVFILGSAFSNDQAWVEGAFCTAESILVDYLGLKSMVDESIYPLICRCSSATAKETLAQTCKA